MTDKSGRTGLAVADFLLDRIDEEQDIAWGGAPSPWMRGDGDGEVLDRHGDVTLVTAYGGTFDHVLHFDPTRVLTGLEATRDAVLRCAQVDFGTPTQPLAFGVLWELARTYRTHPDFRKEWSA